MEVSGTKKLLVLCGLVAAGSILPSSAGLAGTPAVQLTSHVSSDGSRVLQHQIDLNVPVAKIWRAFTTSEGLRGFVAPVAAIDFRIGGIWEASYDPAGHLGDPANILNEVLAYLPDRMLAIRIVRTPPGFPHPELAKQLWTVIRLTPLGDHRSRVTASMCGWGRGADWDGLYRMFEQDNATVLRNLARYLAGEPINWK